MNLGAASGASLSIRSNTSSVKIGKPHLVQVLGEGVASLGTATLAIKFDPKRLQVLSVEVGSLLGPDAELTYTVEQETLKITFRPKSTAPLREAGELVRVKWTPLTEGKAELNLTPSETLLLDRAQSALNWRGKAVQLSVVR